MPVFNISLNKVFKNPFEGKYVVLHFICLFLSYMHKVVYKSLVTLKYLLLTKYFYNKSIVTRNKTCFAKNKFLKNFFNVIL